MSHPIAKALEDAAQRIGRTISKDAAKAVSEMYEQAGHGAQQVVKNIAAAEEKHTREIVELAEKIAKNGGETGEGAKARLMAQADARTRLASKVGVKGDYDVELVVDHVKYPESADHIREAQRGQIWTGSTYVQGTPKPSVLTIERTNSRKNRRDSLRGIATRPPEERDEYPPAMFKEGGKGASVKYIDGPDNGGSGSVMGSALSGLPKGTRVRIRVR